MDEIAFIALYQNYHQLVYQIAYHYLHNAEDAEEITQDVFVQVYGSLAKFEGKSSIKTWIYRISINKSLDFIKHKNSKKRGFIFGGKSQNVKEIQLVTYPENADAKLLQQENEALLHQVIEQLPTSQKTAFILAKIEGLSYAEIAEIMQTSVSAIEALVFRSKKTLREQLAHLFEEYHKNNKNKSSI